MADFSRAQTPVEDLLTFAKTQLQAVGGSDLDVRTFYSADLKDIYAYLDTITPDLKTVAVLAYPQCIRKKEPQTIYVFDVYVISKDWGSLDKSLIKNSTAVRLVYSALDYQVYPTDSTISVLGSNAVFRADKDEQEERIQRELERQSKNTMYRCTFYIEDN